MATSSLISSINSLSDFLDTIHFASSTLQRERACLNNLKDFVLCATTFGNDSYVESVFSHISDVLLFYPKRQVEELLHYKNYPGYVVDEMDSFASKIDEWYETMSDPTTSPQSNSLTPHEIVEITDSILHNILLFRRYTDLSDLQIAMEPLRVQLTFLKNFLPFAIKTCCEEPRYLHDLFTHFETVAISAAHMFFLGPVTDEDDQECEEMLLKISELLQNSKPDNLQFYQNYSQALSRSKLYWQLRASTQDMDDDSLSVLENFLDSLILLLFDFLRLDTCQLSFVKDPSQQLYEGLRSLGAFLRQQQQQGNLDQELVDQIGVLVCDAGVFAFSLQQTRVQINPGLQDFLERIKVIQSIKVGVEDRVPQTSVVNTQGTSSELAILDSLLENLMDLTSHIGESAPKTFVPTVQEGLVFLRSFLEKTMEFRNEPDHELQELRHHALDVLYRVQFLFDQLIVGDISNSLSALSDYLIQEMENTKTVSLLKIPLGNRDDVKAKEVIQTSSDEPSVSNPSKTDELVGFHDEATSIVDRLTRGSKQLRVVAICGMGGAGKTALALKVFNHPYIMCYFNGRGRARCVISQVLDKKKVLIQLLNQIDSKSYSTMSEDDLEQKLWRSLKGKRYLIFLDDVWNLEDWNSLARVFPDDSLGSRIIVTSRLGNVVPEAMLDEQPHYLRPLTKEESLELMQRKLFPGKAWPPQLFELGMEITEICKGLPLMVVIVAGLLAKKNQEDWKQISSHIGSSKEPLMNAFELSFKHLPNRLKPCFLYLGAFQQDEEVSVKRLIRLWISEGFVQKLKQKSTEDVAEQYMAELIERSLVMVARTRSIGGVKTCRIHDLMHDFCSRKVKEEDFFHFLQGQDQLSNFGEPTHLRRLCIYDKEDHFKESKLFWPRTRTLLFIHSSKRWYDNQYLLATLFIIPIFKLLKVLDLEQIDLGSILPSGIELLIHLKYLSVRGSMNHIPSSIGKLSNLETFILISHVLVTFPNTFWSLQKLRCISIKSESSSGGGVYPHDFESSSVLYDLASFSGAVVFFPGIMEKQMKIYPNIRRLKLCYDPCSPDRTKKFDKIVIPDSLNLLESLHLWNWNSLPKRFDFDLPSNLRKLTLVGFKMPWEKILTIGKLPNLEVVKLKEAFSGYTWKVDEGEFSNLRILELSDLDVIKWVTDSDDQFPCLQQLMLDSCTYLQEIPSHLQYIPTLEEIDVRFCSSDVERIVEGIKEEQEDLGNSSMKISIKSHRL